MVWSRSYSNNDLLLIEFNSVTTNRHLLIHLPDPQQVRSNVFRHDNSIQLTDKNDITMKMKKNS